MVMNKDKSIKNEKLRITDDDIRNSKFVIRNSNIPRLRFPEFEKEGEWEEKMLGDITDAENSTLALNKIEIKEKGYPVYGADGIIGLIGDYQQEEPYISIVKDGSGVGRVNLCEEKSSILGTLTCIKSKNSDKFKLNWIYYLMNTINYDTYKKGSGIPHIYYFDYKTEVIAVPNPKEQQKIAACLSSLDEVIEGHTRKLELLRGHKKGLMQNLFPNPITNEKLRITDHDNRNSQFVIRKSNVPNYRFPEFKDDGEWEEKRLGEVAEFSKGKGISKNDLSEKGTLPCIRYGELYTHYKEKIVDIISSTNLTAKDLVLSKANDVIIPASGETQEDIATASCVLVDGVALGGDLNIIRSDINGVFLAYYLNNAKKNEIAQMAQGISVVHLYSIQLKDLVIQIPTKQEQQKIASCLSALDSMIQAQTERIEQLQQHKKGLMQNLFPITD